MTNKERNDKRLKYPLFEVYLELFGFVTGSCDCFRDQELYSWLVWRLSDGWDDSPFDRDGVVETENKIRELGFAIVKSYESFRGRLDKDFQNIPNQWS